MDEFRFHMTLTGRLDETRRGPIVEMLCERFAAIGIDSLTTDRIALFRQDGAQSRFQILDDWPLRAAGA